MELTSRQLQYGFDYFHKDEWKHIAGAITVADYRGRKELIIECTQLSDKGPQYIHIDSLDFLAKMPQLRFLDLVTYRLKKRDYHPILKCRKLEHLTLPYSREVKAAYGDLVSLPKLKWGLLKKQPKLYVK